MQRVRYFPKATFYESVRVPLAQRDWYLIRIGCLFFGFKGLQACMLPPDPCSIGVSKFAFTWCDSNPFGIGRGIAMVAVIECRI